MDPILLFSQSAGLNTVDDPVRVKYDPETGVTQFTEAVNIKIDDTGRASRRRGNTLLQSGEFHSLFCDEGDCFVIEERASDAALKQVATDYTLTGIRSGLTQDRRTSFCQIGLQTFYSNGKENGVIENGTSSPWPVQEHVGAETSRSFSEAPLGTHLAFFAGRMWIAEGPVLWYSEPYAYGKYDKTRCFFWFASDITMVKPVSTGIFVSDSKSTYFLSGTNPQEMVQLEVLSTPAHEWSDVIGLVKGSDFGVPEAGLCALWSSNDGLILGLRDGSIINLTDDKIDYPSGIIGTTILKDGIVINTVE